MDMAGDVDLETEKGMMKGILQQLEPTARAISTTHRQVGLPRNVLGVTLTRGMLLQHVPL